MATIPAQSGAVPGDDFDLDRLSEEHKLAMDHLDSRLFIVVCVLLVVLTGLFVIGLLVQSQTYRQGIDAALSGPSIDHAAAISYSRALDAAFIKTSALFLGFLLVFTGTLYVLRSASVAYQLGVKGKKYGGHLETSSPGLVIITLGVVLIAITILSHSDINYDAPSPPDDASQIEQLERLSGAQPIEAAPTLQTTAPPSERKK